MSKKLAIAMFGQKRLSREGGVEIVVKELCTRMAQNGCDVTCYNRAGHHVSGAEYDDAGKTEYEGIRQKSVPTIERRGLAAVSSSAFAALYSAFGKYDVVHIHAEGPAFFAWLVQDGDVHAPAGDAARLQAAHTQAGVFARLQQCGGFVLGPGKRSAGVVGIGVQVRGVVFVVFCKTCAVMLALLGLAALASLPTAPVFFHEQPAAGS